MVKRLIIVTPKQDRTVNYHHFSILFPTFFGGCCESSAIYIYIYICLVRCLPSSNQAWLGVKKHYLISRSFSQVSTSPPPLRSVISRKRTNRRCRAGSKTRFDAVGGVGGIMQDMDVCENGVYAQIRQLLLYTLIGNMTI